MSPVVSPGTHVLNFNGRDKTGDLVDCHPVGAPSEYKNVGLQRIVAEIAAPFKINVRRGAGVDLGKVFTKWSLQPNETAFESIERACREKGILPLSNENGEILLTTNGLVTSEARLIYGQNVKRASSNISFINRFSQYTVKSTHSNKGKGWGSSNIGISAKATDEGVVRFRPKVFAAEGAATQSTAQTRVNWEANTRAARAETSSVTVKGWRQSDGSDLKINPLIDVIIPPLKFSGTLLVSSISFILSPNDGTITRIGLKRPDAYEPEPPDQVKAQKGASGWPGSTT